jgi:Putative adhesin
MTRLMRSRLPLAAAALAGLLAGPACVDIMSAEMGKFVDRQEKRFSTTALPDVDVSTFDGAIEIRAWDRPEVLVVIEKHARDKADADTIEVHAEQNGNHVTVDARVPKAERTFGISWHRSRMAKLIVSVPSSSNIVAKSGDGPIDVERITGRVDLRSGDGSIQARDLSGDVRAHTGDGSMKLDGVNGALDVDTGDGTISVSGTFTSLHARSGDGSVTVRAASGSAATGDWDIVTGDGSVTLELPDGFGGELDAHTGDGGIHLQDISVSNVTGEITRKNTVRGTLGSGGKAVRVRTGDGTITLRRF